MNLFFAALLLIAASGNLHAADSPSPLPLKPACRGLMLRDYRGSIPEPLRAFINDVVVLVRWDELETSDQTFDGPGWARIDRALDRGLRVRLRILAGIHAPDFVKTAGGDPVLVVNSFQPEHRGTVPRFWTREVLDHYEQLMREVARRYEHHDDLCEVVASGAMTIFAEPLYRAQRDADSHRRLAAAGLDADTDRAAHDRVLRIHHEVFLRTRTTLAINAWDVLDADGQHTVSIPATRDFVLRSRELMGSKLVLQNNGLRSRSLPAATSAADNIYAFLTEIDGPKGYQTATLVHLGASHDNPAPLIEAISHAVRSGAQFIELPAGSAQFTPSALAQLHALDAALSHNARDTVQSPP